MNVIRLTSFLFLAAIAASAAPVRAAFIVEGHPTGKANATNFAFLPGAGNGTAASTSTAVSTAAGLSATGSIFGSNNTTANIVDVYQFSYTPGVNADNTVLLGGAALGNSSASDADGAGAGPPAYAIGPLTASGRTGGITGTYNVYFTSPSSTNVNPAGSTFDVTNAGATVSLNPVNLNDTNTGPDEVAGTPFTGGANNRWLRIATVQLAQGQTYTVTVTSNVDSFVSQRAHGVMWELAVPEPASCALAGFAALGLLAVRRRN